jgi:sortase (surface protein transpeptidase)
VLCAVAGVGFIGLFPERSADPVRVSSPLGAVAAPLTATSEPAAPPGSPASPTASASLAAPAPLTASVPTRVQIPALDVTSDVMRLGLEQDGSMQVPPGAYPVGWYEGSPTPGELGPSILAGHVDWGGERGAFYGLRELVPGDRVMVDRADGSLATFRVERVVQYPKDEFPSDVIYGDIDHAGLRLITCGGAFNEGTGNYVDNVVVFARLVAPG